MATSARVSPVEVGTAEERMRFGKSRRNAVSRTAHSELRPKDRKLDPIQVLLSSVDGRLPQLLPLKYSGCRLRLLHSFAARCPLWQRPWPVCRTLTLTCNFLATITFGPLCPLSSPPMNPFLF